MEFIKTFSNENGKEQCNHYKSINLKPIGPIYINTIYLNLRNIILYLSDYKHIKMELIF